MRQSGHLQRRYFVVIECWSPGNPAARGAMFRAPLCTVDSLAVHIEGIARVRTDHSMKTGESEVQLHTFLDSALEGGVQLNSPAALPPRKEPMYPLNTRRGDVKIYTTGIQ